MFLKGFSHPQILQDLVNIKNCWNPFKIWLEWLIFDWKVNKKLSKVWKYCVSSPFEKNNLASNDQGCQENLYNTFFYKKILQKNTIKLLRTKKQSYIP